jgi:hypothetical protein
MSDALEAAYQAAKAEASPVPAETLAEACEWLNARIEEIETRGLTR